METVGKTAATKRMPFRIPPYLKELMERSPAVAAQFLPDAREAAAHSGENRPWVGCIDTGVKCAERMYEDRVIIITSNICAAYCRFCIRSDYLGNLQDNTSKDDLERAFDYISKDTRIREVLLTGGDPLMNLRLLRYALEGLSKIENISVIRIGTRVPGQEPERIDDGLVALLRTYAAPEKTKTLEIGVQFNHPDELTAESVAACRKLMNSGIRVYSHTTLLKGVNDNAEVLGKLWRSLRHLGIETHYLYHCDDVLGAGHFRTSVQKGINIMCSLSSGRLSRRAIPDYIVLTPVGKVQLGVDAEIIGRDGEDLVIKTSYRLADFKEIDPNFRLPAGCHLSENGFIIARYRDGRD